MIAYKIGIVFVSSVEGILEMHINNCITSGYKGNVPSGIGKSDIPQVYLLIFAVVAIT